MSDYRSCRYCSCPILHGSVHCDGCGMYAPTGGKPVRWLGKECRRAACLEFDKHAYEFKPSSGLHGYSSLLVSPSAAGMRLGPDESGPSEVELVTGPNPACRSAACWIAEQHGIPVSVITLNVPGDTLAGLLSKGAVPLATSTNTSDGGQAMGLLLVENVHLARDYGLLRSCGEPSRPDDWPWKTTWVLAHALGSLTGAGKCDFEWPLEAGGVERFSGGGICFVDRLNGESGNDRKPPGQNLL